MRKAVIKPTRKPPRATHAPYTRGNPAAYPDLHPEKFRAWLLEQVTRWTPDSLVEFAGSIWHVDNVNRNHIYLRLEARRRSSEGYTPGDIHLVITLS